VSISWNSLIGLVVESAVVVVVVVVVEELAGLLVLQLWWELYLRQCALLQTQ